MQQQPSLQQQLLDESSLAVQPSQIPKAGLGLYTLVDIKKDVYIVEYKGAITTWAAADHQDGDNPFIFYINEEHVIDGSKDATSKSKYANDARGLTRVEGLRNNATFIEDGVRVFIQATRNIKAGSEILVNYGPDYWKTVRKNIAIDAASKKTKP